MKIFVYSGTHWDREWYQCFQGFRYRLVEMADGLVDGLERRKDYGVFHFDGQTIVLEDILEIAPDLEERLGRLIRAGKIKIGPWYCMPDEFIISGESLIRNLQIGKEICKKWGVEPTPEGYICDIFGHIAQMPQIFDGMNIHHAVLGRGTNEHTTPMHFRWQSPDGTDVITYRLNDEQGYSDLTSFGARTTAPQESADPDEVAKNLKGYCDRRFAEANIPVVMLLDALDHNSWHGATPDYVAALKKLYPDAEVYHTDVMEMCAAVDEYRDELPFKAGELNETTREPGGYAHLITNVLSSRYPIKKANDQIQTTLEKLVQPLYAYGIAKSRDGFLKLAQKYLIMNHPHDSICGCSIDQVHRDMMYRFDQSRLLSNEILARVYNSMRDGLLEAPAKTKENAPNARILRLYNPLPYRITRMVETDIHFPKNFAKYREPFGYEDICAFKLYDADGSEVPYGVKEIKTYGGEDVYTVAFEARLTPSGLVDYEARPSNKPTRYLSTLTTGTLSAENEWIRLSVNETNGTITLLDKENGAEYRDLLQLNDDGEIGDGWFHCNPKIDRTVTGTFVSAEKCEDNINAVTFRINVNLRLPAEVERHNFGTRRSETCVDVPVSHYVTLYRTERYVKVRTVIDNKALDHRLKLRLNSGIIGKRYLSSQAFCFVERDTDSDPDTADWKETAQVEKATEGTVVKYGGSGNGLALISRYGLHECAVYADGRMDLTLLRCYRTTVGTNGEPDGQLQGMHEFEYLIVPTDRERQTFADLQKLEDTFRADVLAVTTEAPAGRTYAGGLDVQSDTFCFSTANKLENGMEFRVFNCSDGEGEGEIVLPKGAKTATLTRIDGRPIAELPVEDGRTSLILGKWKIATVQVTF